MIRNRACREPKCSCASYDRERPRSDLWRAVRRFPFRDPDNRSRASSRPAPRFSRCWGCRRSLARCGADAGLFDQPAADGRPGALPSQHDDGALRHPRKGLRLVCAGAARGGAVLGVSSGAAQAIFSIEDKSFERNSGMNLIRVVGAAWRDVHSRGGRRALRR
jgi:penicillin-binding protein 1A